MKRREFIRTTSFVAGGFVLGFPSVKAYADVERADLVMVKDGSPSQLVDKAIELLGGMSRFVSPGQTVVVKPNMSWDRAPEYSANTNPEIAAEVVRLCIKAGAKKVLAFDRSCQDARRCYINSGLEKAMSEAGASVRFIHEKLFEPVNIPDGFVLDKWDFYRDALETDVLINLPVLKHHSLSRLSLGLKNMMGLIGGNRGTLHASFDTKIVDINRVLRPQLTIIDAVRVLRANGPSGGSLDDVDRLDTVIAGVDPVLVDAWGAKLAGLEPEGLKWLRSAAMAGLGSMDTVNNQPLEYSFI